MELRVICSGCNAEYRVSDEQLDQRSRRFACKRCGKEIVLKPGSAGLELAGATIKSPFDQAFPVQVGKYQVRKRLASGGMGNIFLATQSGAAGFEHEVVLKVLHSHLTQDKGFAQAIVDEAKLTVLLKHPNIVHLYDLVKIGNLLFSVMEHVPGKSLARIQRAYRKKGGQVPLPMAIGIAVQVLDGLAYAHELVDAEGRPLGIVHRDVSPQNILVDRNGWVKIIDFGIAKAAGRMTQTAPGMIKGKFAYMAPEQLKGTPDHRVDIFAMGVVLWETLTGVRLFHSSTDVDTLQKLLKLDPPPVSLQRTDLPPELDRILGQALAKDPDQRYPSARAFRADLMTFMAPVGLDEMREAVDIDAACLGEDAVPAGEVSGGESEITPVHEPGPTVAVDTTGVTRRSPPKWAWLVLGAGFVVGLAVAALWGLGLLDTQETRKQGATVTKVEDRDAGHPLDAGASGLAGAGSGADPGPADAGGMAAMDPGPPDAGKSIAKNDQAGQRAPPPKRIHLTNQIIEKFMRRNRARLQQCADRHLAGKTGGGDVQVVLGFTIASGGRVIEASLTPAELADTRFGRCLLGRVRRIHFPRHADKAVSIDFPVKFRVVGGK